MRRLILFAMFCTTPLYAQTQYEYIESDRLGTRELKIQLPRNYEENTEKYYPLILVLDGDFLFEIVAGNVDYTSYWADMPEALVVGINQVETRSEDLFVSDATFFPTQDGAKFYEFLGAELMPYLEENYRLGTFKVAVGHGASANFINFYSFRKTPLFQAYIALSPSMSPYMDSNLTEQLADLKSPLFYYMSTASEDFRDHRKDITALNTKLEAIDSNHLFYAFDNFDGLDHYGLVNTSIPKALQHIFLVFQPISRSEYKKYILPLETSPVAYLTEKYDRIETLFGIEKQILLNDFRAIASALDKKEQFEYFKDLAKLARESYPDSVLHNYYMGRFYEATGNPKKAMKTYREAYIYQEIDGITKDDLLDKADRIKVEYGY
ncbi:alpha/beta hydrolase-fold protein [Flavobacteriaceae bacterium]|nr:alpha/beta hydrolase-fold protein [Flavobacteriaceae bacterium]MDB2632511.1 alpha/beta hydrolase-fold protein [Flavobacteriaceae bacterium]